MTRHGWLPLGLGLLFLTVGCALDQGGEVSARTPVGGRADDASGSTTAVPELRFDTSFGHVTPTAPLVGGGRARVVYDRDRMYHIVNGEVQYGGFFATSYHCYGYGCCEVGFPTVGVHYRFGADEGWTDGALGEDGSLELSIPAHAERLELWFDTPGFDLRTWYCGCDQACSDENYTRAGTEFQRHQAWDSRYAQNFVFPVSPATTVPTILFDSLSAPPSGSLHRGERARIAFRRDRFYDIVNWSTGDGHYFAYGYHCYGYGCCEVGFETINVHYRFQNNGAFVNDVLSADDDTWSSAEIEVPSDASMIEVYFDIPGFDIRTWYCGCDPSCADESYRSSTPRHIDYLAWDSRYGANYVLPLD